MSSPSIYINLSDVGWFQRRAACQNNRSITITEGAQGTINLKTTTGLAKQVEKTITLGEEHSELLPNGQESKVSKIKKKLIYPNGFLSILTIM